MSSSITKARAIIRITAITKSNTTVNYSRRMYAILRRYTPDAAEGAKNECFAELTGLRTFFKMTYAEMSENIINDMYTEIGIRCAVTVARVSDFEQALLTSKKSKNVSTYKEMNTLFAGHSLAASSASKLTLTKKVRLTVPFLGKVS